MDLDFDLDNLDGITDDNFDMDEEDNDQGLDFQINLLQMGGSRKFSEEKKSMTSKFLPLSQFK